MTRTERKDYVPWLKWLASCILAQLINCRQRKNKQHDKIVFSCLVQRYETFFPEIRQGTDSEVLSNCYDASTPYFARRDSTVRVNKGSESRDHCGNLVKQVYFGLNHVLYFLHDDDLESGFPALLDIVGNTFASLKKHFKSGSHFTFCDYNSLDHILAIGNLKCPHGLVPS
jgi:hypothetical protein